MSEAISGGFRSGRARSGAFNRARVVVEVNGQRTQVIKAGLAIRTQIGREPATADLAIVGGPVVPERGQAVLIGHGTTDNVLFRGRVVRAVRQWGRYAERAAYELEAAGALRPRVVVGEAFVPWL